MTKSILCLLLLSLITISISSCTKPIPVRHGNIINISKESINKVEGNLAIHWFGTSNYLISLGNNSIMTDPFVSHQKLLSVISGSSIRSNNEYIKNYYKDVDVPDAIFIGHSHYDHLMDTVPYLDSKKDDKNRCNVPIYGSLTTKYILHGYPRDCNCENRNYQKDENWSLNFKKVIRMADWKQIEIVQCNNKNKNYNPKIQYKAYVADHAPHVRLGSSDILLFQGHLYKPLKVPPNNAYDYKEGYTYFYMFNIINDNDTDVSYKIGLAGAATDIEDYELKYLKKCNPNNNDSVTDTENEDHCLDVLIISVPGWKYKDEYPKGLIDKLKPRYIILSHFDNFFETDRDKKPIKTVPLAGLDEFILQIQDDINSIDNYGRFEKIIIPDVDTTVYLSK